MQTWDLVTYAAYLFRRWKALVLVAAIVSGITAFVLIQITPPQYVTTTTLMVGTNLRSKNPNEQVDRMTTTLAAFYADMARRTPITQQVVDDLQLPFGADVLNNELVSARVVPQAQLIEISVVDTDPERAMRIANAVGGALIGFSPTSPDDIQQLHAFVKTQLSDLEERIRNTDSEIKQLSADIANMTSAGEIAEAQRRLEQLEDAKAEDQQTYGGLLSNLDNATANTLSVFEPASTPMYPLPRRVLPLTVLAVLLGAVCGMSGAWLLEALDDRWRQGRAPDLVVGIPALNEVPTRGTGLAVADLLATPRGHQCLALQSELLIRLRTTTQPLLMITSANPSLDRSRLSMDLGRLFAHGGQQVLLIDANLGTTPIASMFGLAGDGVQALLHDPERAVADLTRSTDNANLVLLPGSPNEHGTMLVPALHWARAVEAIKRHGAELTLIDGPPVLHSADATLLAPHTSGVVLVIDPATERCGETRHAIARLRSLDVPLLGVVLLTPEGEGVPRWQRLRQLLPFQKSAPARRT